MAEEVDRAKSVWSEIAAALGIISLKGLIATESSMANAVEKDLIRVLKQSGWLYSSNNYVIFGQSCVQAANDRGAYVAPHLPTCYTIISVTSVSKLHTYNAMFFKAQSGQKHYWLFDTYVAGITTVKYAGTFLPKTLYHNSENFTNYGGRPGRWW